MHKTEREWIAEADGAVYHYTLEPNCVCPNSRFDVISRRPVVNEEQAAQNNREICRILLHTLKHEKETMG